MVIDRKLTVAAEEKWFLRVKHWAGFPSMSIKYYLKKANLESKDIDHIAVYLKIV